MGNILKSRNDKEDKEKKKEFFKDIPKEILDEEDELFFEDILEDEFLCSKCNEVPEILHAHNDNSKIEFICRKCGPIEDLTDKYLEKSKKSKFSYRNSECKLCKLVKKNNDMFFYCYECQKDYCKNCLNKNAHKCKDKSKYIKVNEKNTKCLKHFGENFTQFCVDCQENVCKKEINIRHKDHEIIDINNFLKEFLKYRIIIKEKNKELSNLIKFINLIDKAGEKCENNYFNIQSVIKLAESIEKENIRDSKDIEFAFYELNEKLNSSKEAIESFNEKFDILIQRNQEELSLSNIGLKNEGFELITRINFNQLKDINVSGNKIKNIELLKKMNLLFLEYLNMSNNQIENIEPIKKLNSKEIKEIFLHNNKIQKIDALLDTEFPKLEILRIEGNKEIEKKENEEILNQLKKKYKNKIIDKEMTFEEFNEKYNCQNKISKKSKIIDLRDKNGKDEMIKDLYLILTNETNENEITKLILMNNEITESSKLNRIPLPKLKELDLSKNNINSIEFLEKMDLKSLTELYLDDNKIFNFESLTKISFEDLRLLSIKNNNNKFINEDTNIKNIIENLKEKYKDNDIVIKYNN